MAWPLTTAMAAALTSREQRRTFRADVLNNGVPVITGLRVTSGQVTVSSTQTSRRSLSLVAVDDGGDLVPGVPTDALAPYGNELAVYRGLMVPNPGPTPSSTQVLIPMGVFQLNGAVSAWSGASVQVTCTGADRSTRVARAKLTDYMTIADGTNAGDAIMALVMPSLAVSQAYSFTTVGTVNAQTYAPGADRWAEATKLAEAVGCLLYFDAGGTLNLTPVPDPRTQAPAWTYTVDSAGVLTAISSQLDRTAAANVIVATAQGSGVTTPLLAVAQDNDPLSPTYVAGPFGSQVSVVQTSAIDTQADLQAYADAQLLLSKGATQQVSLTCNPLPHLDAFDVIAATVPRVKLSGRYVIDQLSIPLGAGTMSVTTRGIVV